MYKERSVTRHGNDNSTDDNSKIRNVPVDVDVKNFFPIRC